MQQYPRALDVAEEAVADAGALGRALDQAGDVGDDEFAALVADDPQLRAQGRERIIADLCAGVADRIEEGRLAGVGQPDETDVGEQFEAQPQPHLLAGDAGLVLARSTVGRGLVAGVAAPAQAAMEQGHLFANRGEVGEQRALFVVGEDLGADRDLDDEVGAARPGPVRAGTTLAARGAEMLRVAKVDQRIEARDRLEHDVAALAAVAAVGAAELDELLAPERHRPGAAGARLHEDLGLVEEMHCRAELGGRVNLGQSRRCCRAVPRRQRPAVNGSAASFIRPGFGLRSSLDTNRGWGAGS